MLQKHARRMESMKLLKYEVSNVLRISDVNLNMDGHHLVLFGGKNGQGKSSAIKALLMALCGKSGMDWPDIALKDGENKGWVRVHLSGDAELHDDKGFIVELLLRRRRGGNVIEEFRVLDSAGEEAPEPRALLKRLYEFRAFDPLSFERAKPKERADMLRRLVGLDFDALDAERKEIFDKRTIVNREGKALASRLEAIQYPEDTPDGKLSVVQLVSDKEKAQAHNRMVDREHQTLKEKKDELVKLAEEREKLQERLVKITQAKAEQEALVAKEEQRVAELCKLDVDAIQKRIQDADEINSNVEKKLQALRLNEELKDMRAKAFKLNADLERIDREKQERLENAAWPLPNMSLDETGVLMDGLPFEQASKAQRVLASVKVGMALNPKLKLLVCEEGNDLDLDTLKALEDVLTANDYQMILEFVTRSQEDEDRCCVVFKEGKAVKGDDRPLLPDVLSEDELSDDEMDSDVEAE